MKKNELTFASFVFSSNQSFLGRLTLNRKRKVFWFLPEVLRCYSTNATFLTPYILKEKCFDKIPNYYQDTLYYVDSINCQIFSFATELAFHSNPAKIIALDTYRNEFYLLTPTPVNQDPPVLFKLSENRTTIQANTFSAFTADFHSPKRKKHFWNRSLFTMLSDKEIQVFGKARGYHFFHDHNLTSEDNKETLQSHWTRQMRKGTTDHISTATFFFTELVQKKSDQHIWTALLHLEKCVLFYATYQFLPISVTTVMYVTNKTLQVIKTFGF